MRLTRYELAGGGGRARVLRRPAGLTRPWRHRAAAVIAGSAVLALATVAGPASSAQANNFYCTGGDPTYHHCYYIGFFGSSSNPTYVNAYGTTLTATCLVSPSLNQDFYDWEAWLPTNLNNRSLNTWVEAGLTDGPITDSNGSWYGLQWFWADNRPNGGSYHEHHYAWANTPITESVSFWWDGGGRWSVYEGNSWMGDSASNGDYGGNGQVGAEITDWNGVLKGSAASTWYWDPRNNSHSASLSADTRYRGPMNGSVSGDHMNAYTGTCNATRTAHTTPPPASPPTTASLAAMARAFASRNGDPRPSNLQLVVTSRGAASALTGSGRTGDSTRIYFLQMRGHFTGHAAHVPPGKPLPTGNTLTMSVDAATGLLLDWGITSSPAPLARLGQVHTLP